VTCQQPRTNICVTPSSHIHMSDTYKQASKTANKKYDKQTIIHHRNYQWQFFKTNQFFPLALQKKITRLWIIPFSGINFFDTSPSTYAACKFQIWNTMTQLFAEYRITCSIKLTTISSVLKTIILSQPKFFSAPKKNKSKTKSWCVIRRASASHSPPPRLPHGPSF
jgi:hypothetical protein